MGNLRYIGRLATLAFLVIGMFAFGLTFNKGQLDLKWPDILAVFIVFILADLGVELVYEAGKVRESVQKAAERAEKVNEGGLDIIRKVTKLEDSIERTVLVPARQVSREVDSTSAKLKKQAKELDNAVESLAPTGSLHLAGLEFCKRSKVSWQGTAENLESFLSCWQPVREGDEETETESASWLLEEIMKAFCCQESGVVKVRDPGDIAFVAADSTFCTISERWLEEALGMGKTATDQSSKQRTVVWAVSTLLPTEFAFPSICWPDNPRVPTLERFVKAVKDSCNKDNPQIEEYRRLTVIADSDESRWCKFAVKAIQEEAFKLYRGHLEKIVVWDLSLVAENSPFREIAVHQQESVCHKCGFDVVQPEVLLELVGASQDGIPDIGSWDRLEAGTAYSFLSTFRKSGREEKKKEFLFCLKDEMVLKELVRKVIDKSQDLSREFRPIKEIHHLEEFEACDEGETHRAAEYVGLYPLSTWYVEKLHRRADNGNDASYWLTLDEETSLNPFEIRWDGGLGWHVLDLLLIGTLQDEPNDAVDWIGALQSDLDLNDPACLVRAVTSKATLNKLGKCVEDLFASAKSWSS